MLPNMNKISSIFLSHSSKDRFIIEPLARDLMQCGVKVWLDEAELELGDSLIERIGDAIAEIDYLGVVLTKNSVKSEWVKREVEIAINFEINQRKVKVLPLLFDSCKIPVFLSTKVYADFKKNYPIALKKLIKKLRAQPSKLWGQVFNLDISCSIL